MKIKQKKPFTLLEIMIVILLIGLIGSVIGYNMKGSLDEGRAFKTEQASAKIRDILELELTKDNELTPDAVEKNPETYLKKSGLIKDADKFVLDGWGNRFNISVDETKTVTVISDALVKYKENKKNAANEKPAKKKK